MVYVGGGRYFDGRFNENFGTPQRHFSPFLVATYMGFEPKAIASCAATLFDRITATSAAAAAGRSLDVTNPDQSVMARVLEQLGSPTGVVLLEEQLEEVKLLLDQDEAVRQCKH